MTVPITWVDAFTDRPYAGNPAAVCILTEPWPDADMQALATELGLSETAYVRRVAGGGANEFELRWFTPSVEVDLCGHATLATAHTLRQCGEVDGAAPVLFQTRSGPLSASFDGDRIALDFPADPMTPTTLPESLKGQWAADTVTAVGRTGFFLVVVLTGADLVGGYRPDLAAIAATGSKALLITAPAAEGWGADYVLRVFGPNVGIDEDPATGSAQCPAGPYWAERLGKPALVAHQLSARGATFHVRPDGDRVHIAGNARSVLAGHLC